MVNYEYYKLFQNTKVTPEQRTREKAIPIYRYQMSEYYSTTNCILV